MNMKHLRMSLGLAAYSMALLIAANTPAQCLTPLPTNCLAWWRAEGDAADAASFNHGVLVQGAAAGGAGVVGQAFDFNGANGYVLVPDSVTLQPRSLTIEGWFNFRSVGTIHSLVARALGTTYGNSYTLFYWDGALRGFTARPGADNLAYPWSPVPGEWYHLAYTFDDDQDLEALYINGVQVSATNAPGSISYDAHPVLIGADLDYGTPAIFFDGLADEVALYGRALSTGELAAIYTAGSAGKCIPPLLPVFADQFGAGLNTNDWQITQNDPLFTWDASMGDVRFSRPSGGSNVFNFIKMQFQRPLTGDFDAQMDFRGASINRTNGSPGNQVEMHCRIGDQFLAIVRSDETGLGQNVHVWQDPPASSAGTRSSTATNGTLRIRRTGAAVDFYLDQTLLYSATSSTNPVAYLAFALNNNGTTDPTAVTFDNFQVKATTILPAFPTITAQPAGGTLRWYETVSLSVAAVGGSPMAYQWQHYGTNLPGASAATFKVTGLDTNNAGPYRVVVTNAYGAVTSVVANVTILHDRMHSVLPPWLPVYVYAGGPQPWTWEREENWIGPGGYPAGQAVAVFEGAANLTPPWCIRPASQDGVAYVVFESGNVWMGHGGKVGSLIVNGGTLNYDAAATNIFIYGGSHTISAWNCERLELWGGTLSMTGGAEGYPDAFINLYGPFVWNGGTWNGGTLARFSGSEVLLPPDMPGNVAAPRRWVSGVVDNGYGDTNSRAVFLAAGGTLEIAGGASAPKLRYADFVNEGHVVWSAGSLCQTYDSVISNRSGGDFEITGDVYLGCNNSGTFVNEGQLHKTGGTGTATLDALFKNSGGTVGVTNGWVSLTKGGVLNSNVFAASGAGLSLDAGTFSGWGDFDLGAGTLRIAGSALFTGTNRFLSGIFDFAGGSIQNGETTFGVDCLAKITSSASKGLNNCFLNNAGQIQWSGTGTLGWLPATLNNLQSGVFEVLDDAKLVGTTFNNQGLFRKRDSTGTTQFYSDAPFNNSGTVEVLSGRLQLGGGGTIQAPVVVATNAVLEFAGGWTTVTGEFDWPHVVFSDALGNDHLTLNGTFHVGQFDYTGQGYSKLHGTNVIDGLMVWTVGGLQDGETTFTSNSVFQVAGSAMKYLDNYKLNNYGQVSWSGSGTLGHQASVFNNLPSGVFEAIGDARFYGATFNNQGLFRKRDSAGTTWFDGSSPLNNSGTVEVLSGRLQLGGGGAIHAPVVVATNAILEFAGNWFTVDGDHAWSKWVVSDALGQCNLILNGKVSAGELDLNPGNGALSGTNTLDGLVIWNGGGMQDGQTTLTSNSLLRVEGTATKRLANYKVSNAGRVLWSGTGTWGQYGSSFYNLPGGVFEAVGDARFYGATFNNQGVFRKRDSSGTTQFYSSPFNNSGTIEALSGLISLEGGYFMSAGALAFGISSPTNFGRIAVSGNAPLAGSLRAALLNGYRPATNLSFQVMTFGSKTGDFSDISGLNAGNGRYFQPILTSTSLTLLTFATNNPTLTFIGRLPDGNLEWGLTDEIPGVYTLLTSTNLVNWDALLNLTNMSGSVRFSDPLGTNIPYRFYRTAPAQ